MINPADDLAEYLRRAHLDPCHLHQLTTRGYAPDLITAELRSWALGFPYSLVGASALLCGPPGTGKSFSAAWTIPQAFKRGVKHKGVGPRAARFLTVAELEQWTFAKDERRFRMADMPLLILDDWGLENGADWPAAELDALIHKRWAAELPTIATTNLSPDDFAERYPRAYSRLCDARGPGVVVLDRGDLRQRRTG